MGKTQSLHINVVDLQACNCGSSGNSFVYQMINYCDIDTLYGWDTACYHDKYRHLNYYEGPLVVNDGYVKYVKTDGDITRIPHMDELDLHSSSSWFISNVMGWKYTYVYPVIHSRVSQREV